MIGKRNDSNNSDENTTLNTAKPADIKQTAAPSKEKAEASQREAFPLEKSKSEFNAPGSDLGFVFRTAAKKFAKGKPKYFFYGLFGILIPNERIILAGEDLICLDLSYVRLSGADLTKARLIASNLQGSTLIRADFTAAVLIMVDLRGAELIKATLAKADLTKANLEGADLTGCDLAGSDLTAANLKGCNLTAANFTGAKTLGANFDGAIKTDTTVGLNY